MSDQSAAGGGSAGGDSAGNGLNTFLLTVFPFWFHYLINLPGTNWFIGFCGQRDFSITRLYQLWIEKTPSGDFKGEQRCGEEREEIHHVNPLKSPPQWAFSGKWPKNPMKEPGIHYHDRNFYDGLPIMIVPMLRMMNHFILLTENYLYFFRINQTNKLETIYRLEASEAEGRLYKSCAISANGQNMVIHHKCGFSIFRISMIFGQFEVSLLKNVGLLQPSRALPLMSVIGDVTKVKMTLGGLIAWYEPQHLENRCEPSINVSLPTYESIHRFPFREIKEIPRGDPINFFELCQINPMQIGVIVGSFNFVMLLILDLGREVNLRFGAILNLGFDIQQICLCSVNPTHFFVAGKNIERTGEIFLGYEKCCITPKLMEIAIQGDALVKIGEQSFDKGNVSDCSILTSSGGNVIASFIGQDYGARLSVIGRTRKVESSVPKSLSRSTLNGAPIELQPSGVFALSPDEAIVASNADNGLTLFGPDSKTIASTDARDAHKSSITSVYSFKNGSNTSLVSFSDETIKIWSIQKRGETDRLQIVATVSTADLVQKKGVKFLALYGQTLLIVTNQQEFLLFHVEITVTFGIRAEIRPIPGPVVKILSDKIVQGISAVSPTNAFIHVATSEVRGCSLVLVSFVEGAAEVFKSIGTREAGKSPAALTPNGFAVSAVVGTTVNSSALAPGEASFSFNPMEMTINPAGQKAATTATILALASCEGGFIYLTEKGSLIRITYSDDKSVVPKKIAVLDCTLTPKCQLQVSGNTVMVCQPRDDGSFELLTFKF
jgi:hypothetical protein